MVCGEFACHEPVSVPHDSASPAGQSLFLRLWRRKHLTLADCHAGVTGQPHDCKCIGSCLAQARRTSTALRMQKRTPPTDDANSSLSPRKDVRVVLQPGASKCIASKVSLAQLGGRHYMSACPACWQLNAMRSITRSFLRFTTHFGMFEKVPILPFHVHSFAH
jgi:hypothetical protein